MWTEPTRGWRRWFVARVDSVGDQYVSISNQYVSISNADLLYRITVLSFVVCFQSPFHRCLLQQQFTAHYSSRKQILKVSFAHPIEKCELTLRMEKVEFTERMENRELQAIRQNKPFTVNKHQSAFTDKYEKKPLMHCIEQIEFMLFILL